MEKKPKGGKNRGLFIPLSSGKNRVLSRHSDRHLKLVLETNKEMQQNRTPQGSRVGNWEVVEIS